MTATLLKTIIKETVESGNKPKDLKRLSPALGISVKPFDFTNLRIRLAYKDIYRVPTFNDMYYLRIGNTNLKPEKAKQLNAGITWIGNIGDFIDYLSISSDFYYNKVEDKIVAFPTMFIWKMMNLSTVKMLGADVKIFVSIPVTDKINIDLSGVYNYMKAKDRTDKNSKIWGHQIPYTPLHSGSGDISLKMPWINVGYNIIYASERYRLNENIKGNIIDGYTDQSVWIDRKFDFKKHSLRLKFQALNLSDKNYEIIRYYPMAGRNYRLTINYQY